MGRIWTPALAIGVDLVDEQHKELFSRAEKLIDAMSAGKGNAEVGKLLDYLDSYVHEHFLGEERMMQHQHYPGLLRHKRQHEDFKKAFESIKSDFAKAGAASPGAAMVLRLNKLITGWLVEHISNIDMQMGRYLAERNPGLIKA